MRTYKGPAKYVVGLEAMSSSMFRLSRHFSTQTKPPQKTTPRSYIQSLFNEPDLNKLVSNFKKHSANPRVRGHDKLYGKTILRLASANKPHLIQDLLEHQKNYPEIKTEGFCIRLISLYGKAHMTDHAHNLFDELPVLECSRTVKSFNALLNAYVHAKKYDEAESFFREIPIATEIKPDVISYNVVMHAMCDKMELDSAEKMLDEMESNELKLKPSVYTFNILMNGFYSNGRFDDGDRVWDRMVKSGVVPDLVSYNSKLKGLVHVGEISKAVELFEEMEPDVISYNILLRWYGNAGELDEAKGLCDRLKKKGKCIRNQGTYEAVIRCGCEKGHLDFALEVCKECLKERCYIEVAVVQTVINLLMKESRVEEAKELMKLAYVLKHYRSLQVRTPARIG